MLKRNHPPAEGQWWFPGGRVFYRELRIDAAYRKLKEECGLDAITIREFGTYDLIFDNIPSDYASHGITTVFHIAVDQNNVRLDNQSSDYAWKSANDWLKEANHEFLLTVLLRLPQE
ncbi:NUDIX domain-containing protein [bacterium]|nr:NUDIX domain-containing protein [bacterium]